MKKAPILAAALASVAINTAHADQEPIDKLISLDESNQSNISVQMLQAESNKIFEQTGCGEETAHAITRLLKRARMAGFAPVKNSDSAQGNKRITLQEKGKAPAIQVLHEDGITEITIANFHDHLVSCMFPTKN